MSKTLKILFLRDFYKNHPHNLQNHNLTDIRCEFYKDGSGEAGLECILCSDLGYSTHTDKDNGEYFTKEELVKEFEFNALETLFLYENNRIYKNNEKWWKEILLEYKKTLKFD